MRYYSITQDVSNVTDGNIPITPMDYGTTKIVALGILKNERIEGKSYTLWVRNGADFTWEILKRNV